MPLSPTYPIRFTGASADPSPRVTRALHAAGFHTFSHTTPVPVSGADADADTVVGRCADELFSGRAHRRAGAPVTGHFVTGGVLHIRPLGIARLDSPCLVLRADLSRTPDAVTAEVVYATLPGHLECGEERFLLRWERDAATATVTVTAFSRAARPLTRLGGPVARAAQRLMARRYAEAVAHPARQ
jgi:uncharacterized protein (UPF0548 family)